MNPEEQRLQQAVLDKPQDDGPRLAYADWCDARGDARGEFIRLQIEIFRRRGAQLPEEREQQLLAENHAEWSRPFAGIAHEWRFERGFVQWLRMDAGAWLAHAEEVLAAAPITELQVTQLRPVIRQFFGDRHLLRLRFLYLTDCQLGDDDIGPLAASPCVRNLEHLGLSYNRIGAAGAETLAASPNLPHLQTLGFEGNRVELLRRVFRDWDGSIQSEDVPPLLIDLVGKYGQKPWLSRPVG